MKQYNDVYTSLIGIGIGIIYHEIITPEATLKATIVVIEPVMFLPIGHQYPVVCVVNLLPTYLT